MESLIVNISGKVRRERLLGREHLVAPVTLIVPGVLNGSEGPILYLNEENEKSVDLWNNMPLTLGHPKNGSVPISARSAKVLNKYGLGTLLNTKNNGKLQGEAWFDVLNTEEKSPGLIKQIENGKPVELSTGLRIDVKDADGIKIAHNYRPDHLAILIDEVGACSNKDGCGVLINQEGKMKKDDKRTIWNKLGDLFIGNDDDSSESESVSDNNTSEISETNETVEEVQNMKKEDRSKLVDTIVANCGCDKKIIENLDDDTIKKLAVVHNKGDMPAVVKEKIAAAADDDEDEEKEDTENEGKDVKNALSELTEKQLVALLPQSMKDDLKFVSNYRNQQKESIIDQIIDNAGATDDEAKEIREVINSKSLEEIQRDYAFVLRRQPKTQHNYAGMGAGSRRIDNKDESKPDHLLPSDPMEILMNERNGK